MMKRNFMKTILLICGLFPSVSSLFSLRIQGQKQLQGIDSLSFEVIMTERNVKQFRSEG